MSTRELTGWDRLRHGGLLLDAPRLAVVAEHLPTPLLSFHGQELRKRVGSFLDGDDDVADFVTFVVEKICGFTSGNGTWRRGSDVGAEWTRTAVTGQTVRPRHLWIGNNGALLPLFIDNETRLGIGRGQRAISLTLQWLRASNEHLALLTNGRQWRLVFAGIDFDAWCEWDIDLWLEEGELSPQVDALRILISPELWTPTEENTPSLLLQAILDSRKGQAELSAILGERVREAVELLVQGHGTALTERCPDVDPADIYRAAVRVVMRMVVVLFAESRELLPRGAQIYNDSYGLTSLLLDLEKFAARGRNRLHRSWSAWPRVLALFRLVHKGSPHQKLPVPSYGGDLFAPGNPSSPDGLLRALALFETACFDREVMADYLVHCILLRITRTRVNVRQGRSSTNIPVPVDFSDLSSEYIGILYEGLLDFELRTAPEDDPVVFLAVGDQPALPLSRLEGMDDKALITLFEKLKSKTGDNDSDEKDEEEVDAGSDNDDSPNDDPSEQNEAENDTDAGVEAESLDVRQETRRRAEQWARRAVKVGNLVSRPKRTNRSQIGDAYEDAVQRKAEQLVLRIHLPGAWYLVRWGGTRKGSGTFYTRPGLAVPTVQRTLRPLAYTPPLGADGSPVPDTPWPAWKPKTPEEILNLKVCDPACGSGTFPVTALRFLTEALYVSLHFHKRIAVEGDRSLVQLLALPSGERRTPGEQLGEELLPCRPDDPRFEALLKAVLRRYVIERCIYGVDLDPLAVELCRLSLWIETMDRRLPFSFLDHKIKCGNSLVGAWFDQFQHYPVMAWKNRDGGDKNHANGVHFQKETRSRALKAFVREHVTPEMRTFLSGATLFHEDMQARAKATHAEALTTLIRLHDLPVHDAAERARIYREELVSSEAYRSLKAAMDRWCTCWFWPTDQLEVAPLPTTLATPSDETRRVVEHIAGIRRFFHWELEFPDVFRTERSGFDAVVGNPPWDIAKPVSMEFFSNIDPLYRTYGKQEALRFQTTYFAEANVERDWLDYNEYFRAQSNYVGASADPFGDPIANEGNQHRFSLARGNDNKALHKRWRSERELSRGFADPEHSFRHQGSADLNLYKLFLEQSHALLRPGGRLGFIVPSGLYSDQGTGGLRQLFLDRCRWEWLFGFENRERVFAIHRSFKFNPVIIEKGGTTEAIRTAFMHRRLEDWEHAEEFATPYAHAQVERFSPRSKAILEIQSQRDLEILEKIYANSVLLGDDGPDGWGIKYAREFDMTNDSALFPPRPKWEADGYRPDEYSRWLKGEWRPIDELWNELQVEPLGEGEYRCAQPPYDRLPIPRADIPDGVILARDADAWIHEAKIVDIALPLYEGRMIGQFDFSQKGWVSGKGRTAEWRDIEWERKQIEPQYLMGISIWNTERKQHSTTFNGNKEMAMIKDSTKAESSWASYHKVAFIDVTSATNTRTMSSAAIADLPCGNSVPVLHTTKRITELSAILNSLAYDLVARFRCGGVHLNWFIIEETALPTITEHNAARTSRQSHSLTFPATRFAELWISGQHNSSRTWKSQWALSVAERMRLRCILDTIVTSQFGLEERDLRFMLHGCDHPHNINIEDNPTGFWRVDKDKDPELRHTVLTLVAFHDLEEKIRECGGDREKGIEAFLSQNDGEGWMLPETLRLADYGLGHDGRAREHQPVASRFGPRFYDWQRAGSAEESWRECHRHARNMLGEEGYRQLLAEIEAKARGEASTDGTRGTGRPQPTSGQEPPSQQTLFT